MSYFGVKYSHLKAFLGQKRDFRTFLGRKKRDFRSFCQNDLGSKRPFLIPFRGGVSTSYFRYFFEFKF